MNIASLLNPAPLFVEIGPDRLKARRDDDGIELPLERAPDGRLTAQAKEKTIAALKDFLKSKNWQPRARALCAISSRGVSLRRLSLPGGPKEEFYDRLLLQIESEFPLPPDELAWGSQPLGMPQPSNGTMSRQDLLVAAVKKDVVADYYEVLRACGTEPLFTLAASARWSASGQPPHSFAMLDIGESQSEFTAFENAAPAGSRIIFCDGKKATNPHDMAVDVLAQSIRSSVAGSTLFVSGSGTSKDFVERLERTLGNRCECKWLDSNQGAGSSAAIDGLQKFAAQDDGPPLVIRLEPSSVASTSLAAVDWKTWGTRVGALLALALLLPYAEALLLKNHLEKKVAAFEAETNRLAVIDRELDFLQSLKLAQPPYMDLLYVFSKSVPPGTRFEALSMNSKGEVSLRCAFRDGQQVADFRDKLAASGFFTNVVVEEQTPTPDRQKVNVRVRAQEKTLMELRVASAKLAVDDPSKSGKKTAPGMPPGLPSQPAGMGEEP